MNFEEYIKKPFEDQEFEFKEAYWQSAEKLIDNHYKRVRWIRTGIICSVLIAAFIAAYIFVVKKETTLAHPVANQEQNFNPVITDQDISAQAIQPTTSEEILTISPSDSDAETLSSVNIDSNIEKANIVHETNKAKVSDFNSTGSKNEAYLNENKSKSDGRANASQASKKSSKTSSGASNPLAANENEFLKTDEEDLTTVLQNSNSATSSTKKNTLESFPTETQNNSVSNIPVSSDTKETLISKSVASQSTSALNLPFKNIESSGKLQILNFPLHLDFGTNRPILALYRPSRVYATAELLMYPSGNSEAFKFLGFNAGFGYQQPLGRMAFLDMGITGSFRRGNFAPSIVSTQLNYDFGPRPDAYILRPKALFSLQVPVLLGIEGGRHMLSAGVKLGFLIGVRGTSEYANYTHDFESPTRQASYAYDVVDEGWIESSGFKKFALAYALKYQYRLNSRIMIGASLQYLPSDWIANDFGKYYNFTSNEYQNPTGNPAQLIERNWLLGVELKYVLFSK